LDSVEVKFTHYSPDYFKPVTFEFLNKDQAIRLDTLLPIYFEKNKSLFEARLSGKISFSEFREIAGTSKDVKVMVNEMHVFYPSNKASKKLNKTYESVLRNLEASFAK
jgi:hypothetical protein